MAGGPGISWPAGGVEPAFALSGGKAKPLTKRAAPAAIQSETEMV
jgi:hypothetical protein